MLVVPYLVAALVGYLLGGIPTGIVIARARGVDLTQVGSKKTGATNALRALGPAAGAAVFLGDFLKAVVAVALVSWLFNDPWASAIAGIAAVIGHGFSPYIKFQGGRGVTPGLGGLIVISPWIFLVALGTGVLIIIATRFVSLGSMLGTIVGASVLVFMVAVYGWSIAYVPFALVVAVFILISHHDNIGRLLKGSERKIGSSAR